MKLETAQSIVTKAAELGIDASLRERYSGRNMFGKETAGVVVECTGDIVAICSALTGDLENGEAMEFARETRGFRTDNIGKDYIIY